MELLSSSISALMIFFTKRILLFYLILNWLVVSGCKRIINYREGGYPYPLKIELTDTNFYQYPLKNIYSTKHSFLSSYEYLFYQAFDEWNISLQPQSKTVFRFVYSGFSQLSVIIILRENILTVKKANEYELYDHHDCLLSEIEKHHLNILDFNFPLNEGSKRSSKRKYFDSLIKVFPQLLDPKYYHYLLEKRMVKPAVLFTYTSKTFPVTQEQFSRWVSRLNKSGYWKLSYLVKCENAWTDGYGFSLEANTSNRYNFVGVDGCPDDSTQFTKVCQELIKYAGLDKEISLIWSSEVSLADEDIDSLEKK